MRTRSQTMNNEVSYLSTHVVFLHDQYDKKLNSLISNIHRCNSYDVYPSRYSERLRRRNEAYVLDIDFDEASREWLKNKVSVGNGCYTYTKNT